VIRWAGDVRAPPGRLWLEAESFIGRALGALERFDPVFTSWYRPPEVNRAVGGQTLSLHQRGLALDVRTRGRPASQVRSMLAAAAAAGLWAQFEPELRDTRGRVTRFEHLHLQVHPRARR